MVALAEAAEACPSGWRAGSHVLAELIQAGAVGGSSGRAQYQHGRLERAAMPNFLVILTRLAY
ncbi:hypothetical protein BD311DRAFT_812700 [Dichomitus squalens]|uniref:Uncharacterized protein n=1 Tax=Dichomitus squalens TaxID=114155 RepID=A0A4Q9M4Y9_9APHY|nr:hypothetical protein BD311DRAFT_812700 [Dichomitus squalens]